MYDPGDGLNNLMIAKSPFCMGHIFSLFNIYTLQRCTTDAEMKSSYFEHQDPQLFCLCKTETVKQSISTAFRVPFAARNYPCSFHSTSFVPIPLLTQTAVRH